MNKFKVVCIWLFFLMVSLLTICSSKDLWLVLLYWNEPFIARDLYLFLFGDKSFSDESFYKIFILVWLPLKLTICVVLGCVLYVDFKGVKHKNLFFSTAIFVTFIGSTLVYLLKTKGCCMFF